MTEAEVRQLVGGGAGDVAVVDEEVPGARTEQAGSDTEQGGLAGAVRAQQGHDRALGHGEGDVSQCDRVAVAGRDVGEFEPHATSSSTSPR
jgi:hypothetical protein